VKAATRIESLPPYLFAEIDRKVAEQKAKGVDVISLGVGDPDTPTPDHVVRALQEAAADPSTHQYPSYTGMPEFRRSVAQWYGRRFGVTLDPDTQVLPLLGSKEGLAHIPIAFVDPGDATLVPDPGYPVYETATLLNGGTPHRFALTAETDFLPEWDSIDVPARTKLVWLNYPNNPTAAVATLDDLSKAVDFARSHDLLLVYDNAYSELTYDGFVAPSVLQVPGALDVAVEFHSLSKTYNMTGWRIGWVAGSAQAIEALGRVKTNIDSGIWNAIQRAGIAALDGPQDHVASMCALYKRRRDLVVDTFNEAGWKIEPPKGSIYVWLPVPEGHDSTSFATLLLEKTGVVVPPGRGYGQAGEGFIRISLSVPDDRLREGLQRIHAVL
jgi:LL-diaminopimelate aminotransferase